MPKENAEQRRERFDDDQRSIYRLSVKAENNRSKEQEEQPEESYKKEFFEKLRQILE